MIKIKPLTKEQIIISADRLTRFKHPETKYLRVFKDIITSNLIEPKFKKSELDKMDYESLKNFAEQIINVSLDATNIDLSLNKKIFDYENTLFITDENTRKLMDNKINYSAIIKLFGSDIPVNLIWLKNLSQHDNSARERNEKSLKFPLETVVISEGITEEILLPEFAKLCNYDFDKHGIYMISAGGKNQVVKLFYKLAETLKIPIFVLLDKDAQSNYNEIKPRLREYDCVHILNCGEFEDALPQSLIKKALNYDFKNISEIYNANFDGGMVKILEEIFRHRGLHEFKKADFAHSVKNNISTKQDVSNEIAEIIYEIQHTCKKTKVMVDN